LILAYIKNFPKEKKEKVDTFVEYFKEYPESGLELIGFYVAGNTEKYI